MAKAFRTGAVLASLAFVAGWAFRRAFPRTTCPRCGSHGWTRLDGGLKQCRACTYKFFAQLPPPTTPPSQDQQIR